VSHRCYICYKNDLPDDLIYHPKCSKKIFGTEEPPEMLYGLEDIKDLAKQIVRSKSIVTGVQPKISMGIEKARKERGRLTITDGSFILKPPSEKYSQIPENEDLTMKLAKLAGIESVPHALIPLKSGEIAYISRRIDRTDDGKVHMEDLCQLSGLLTENKYRSSMEKVGKTVAMYSADFGLDLFKLYVLTLFCYLIGNNDMHLKNFSLIVLNGRWVISPAYDLLNVGLVLPEDNEETALTIEGRKRKLTRKNFISLGESYKLNERQIENAFKLVCDQNYAGIIENSFLSRENKEGYLDIYNFRLKKLVN